MDWLSSWLHIMELSIMPGEVAQHGWDFNGRKRNVHNRPEHGQVYEDEESMHIQRCMWLACSLTVVTSDVSYELHLFSLVW